MKKSRFLALTYLLMTGANYLHAEDLDVTATGPAERFPSEFAVGKLELVFENAIDPAGLERLVGETWAKSSELRRQSLSERMNQDVAKVRGIWLDGWWQTALHESLRLAEANAYVREKVEGAAAATIYLRFGPQGRFPDRLELETQAALKEKMWQEACAWLDPEARWQKKMSNSQGGEKYELLPLDWSRMWGNENHEIRRKPPLYLALSVLRKDPQYANKNVGGKTVEEWFAILKPHVVDMLRDRVMAGLWAEPGSSYAVITYMHVLELVDLAPDPEIRRVAEMFLDLVFIEDAMLSINNVRGGGRSRAHGPYGEKQDVVNKLMFGEGTGDGRFTIGFEMSDYQVPAIAVALHQARHAARPYRIYNRVPGETRKELPMPGYARDSRLVNYVYRTPGYSMGCSLLNPHLDYHPSSNQRRMSSLLFQSGEYIYPWPKELPQKSASGRSGKAYWSVQHENVMMLQQFADASGVVQMELILSGGLDIVERGGWIFAAADSGYAAVRYIDPVAGAAATSHQWSADYTPHWTHPAGERKAEPTGRFLPLLLHAGDAERYGTFEQFQAAILAGEIVIDQEKKSIEYRPKNGPAITWHYDQNAEPLGLALVNGEPPNLDPEMLFDSPFLKAKFGEPLVHAGAGPFRAIYDFAKINIHRYNAAMFEQKRTETNQK